METTFVLAWDYNATTHLLKRQAKILGDANFTDLDSITTDLSLWPSPTFAWGWWIPPGGGAQSIVEILDIYLSKGKFSCYSVDPGRQAGTEAAWQCTIDGNVGQSSPVDAVGYWYLTSGTSGIIRGPWIDKNTQESYKTLRFRADITLLSDNQKVCAQIEDGNGDLVSDSILPGNSTGFYATTGNNSILEVDLTGCTSVAMLRPRLTISRTNTGFASPHLNWFEFEWVPPPIPLVATADGGATASALLSKIESLSPQVAAGDATATASLAAVLGLTGTATAEATTQALAELIRGIDSQAVGAAAANAAIADIISLSPQAAAGDATATVTISNLLGSLSGSAEAGANALALARVIMSLVTSASGGADATASISTQADIVSLAGTAAGGATTLAEIERIGGLVSQASVSGDATAILAAVRSLVGVATGGVSAVVASRPPLIGRTALRGSSDRTNLRGSSSPTSLKGCVDG